MESIDVLVIGRNCVDYLAVIRNYPAENQKTPILSTYREGGGQAGTAACCVATLGGKVALIAKVGNDRHGKYCLERLKAMKVQTEYVEVIQGGKTPAAHVFITASSGDRTIFYEKNQLPPLCPKAHFDHLCLNARTILLDPESTYLATWLQCIQRASVKIIYDCERWRKGMKKMMAVADYFIPCREFLDDPELDLKETSLDGKMRLLKQQLRGDLIVTLGAEGAAYLHNNTFYHLPALDIDVVDTTGAGDNFHGAFALAISWKMDIHQAVRFAIAVASLSCQDYGGRIAVPNSAKAIAAAKTLS